MNIKTAIGRLKQAVDQYNLSVSNNGIHIDTEGCFEAIEKAFSPKGMKPASEWAWGLSEACNAAMSVKAMADKDTFVDVVVAIQNNAMQAKDAERDRAVKDEHLSGRVMKTIETCLVLRKKELMSRKGHESDKRISDIEFAIRSLKEGTK